MEERDKLQKLLMDLKEKEQSGPVKALKYIEQKITGRDPDSPNATGINGEEDMPAMRGPGGRPRIRQGEDMAPMDHDPDYEQKQMEMMRKVEALQDLARRNDAKVESMSDNDDGYKSMGSQETRKERLNSQGWK